MVNCIFCKIIAGDAKSYKLYESEYSFAFLDINPISEGHTVVIPKKHVQSIEEWPEDVASHFMVDLVKISKHIKEALKLDGINILQNNGKAAGQVVMHSHFHIIPRRNNDGVLNIEMLGKNKPKMTDERFKELHEQMKLK